MLLNLCSMSSISPSLMLAPPVARSTKTDNSDLLSVMYIPRFTCKMKIIKQLLRKKLTVVQKICHQLNVQIIMNKSKLRIIWTTERSLMYWILK